MAKEKYVYMFEEGGKEKKKLLGGKGANLAEMASIGLPIPPGFTITTEACNYYLEKGKEHPPKMKEKIEDCLKKIEKKTGKKFGEKNDPLLVSVRSGAPVSMPGMMDTVLNLGLNRETLQGVINQTNNKRFALDSYRRLIQMFGNVVKGISSEEFEKALSKAKEEKGVKSDIELQEQDLEKIIKEFKKIYKKHTDQKFPENVKKQLFMAISAVFDSWNNKRAITYRKLHKIPDSMGTAVNIQTMVFGNLGRDSGTGVGFTRNPSNGEKKIYGEYLTNAQGEDVVSGARTPKQLNEMKKEKPQIFKELLEVSKKLEKHYRDMQDFEFTIEKGKLWILQTRTGKRTADAAVKIAVDMQGENLISKKEGIMRITPQHLDKLLHKRIKEKTKPKAIAKGLPASPGAAVGKVVFTADEAEEKAKQGKKVILVRPETTPDDIHGVDAAEGILTTRGGMTSHAAVVARGMGKPCIAGCEEINLNLNKKEFSVKEKSFSEGDFLTLDGYTGEVLAGKAELIEPEINENLKILLEWSDEFRGLGVKANADTPEDAAKAREFGAKGIGLCRTEHMFMDEKRLPVVREMILASNKKERKKALKKLIPMQSSDFYEIFKAMDSLPVIVRLLDPPLHEFLPDKLELVKKIARLECKEPNSKKLSKLKKLYEKVAPLSENNPMLGFRGCRLGVRYPEIYEMQVKAIIRAACRAKEEGYSPIPKIMIPLVGHKSEIKELRSLVNKTAEKELKECKKELSFEVGTMIELPRACLVADEIASHADFFSFGTNDLTQTTLGISRDDAEVHFLEHYVNNGFLSDNPFVVLDKSVLDLIKTAVSRGRKVKEKLSIGLCGEHGGNPESIEACKGIGLNYVSCSPFRVPIARLSAAQASISEKEK